MNGKIYLIINRVNGKVYVGQTIRKLSQRFNLHKYDCRRGEIRPLYRAVAKYGWSAFEILEVASASSQNALDRLERIWILALRSADREFGYNLTWGGEHGVRTDEVRQKLRESHLGQKPWNKGKVYSESGRKKLQRVRLSSPEFSEKMRKIALGRKPTPKWVRKKIVRTLKIKGCKPPLHPFGKGPANPNWLGQRAAKSWATRRKGKVD